MTAIKQTADGAAQSSDGAEPAKRPNFAYSFTPDDADEPVTLNLKPLGRMPFGVLLDNRGDAEGQLYDPFLWGIVSPDDLEVLRLIPMEDLPKVLDAWQKDSEVTLGELAGSPGSSASNRAARRSKRI